MANTITNQLICLGKGEVIYQFNMVYVDTASDIIYDSSVIATEIKKQDPTFDDPISCKILEVHALVNAAATARVGLYFDATTDVLAVALPPNVNIHEKYRKSVAIANNAGSGKTGDILVKSSGLSAGDVVTITLHVKPS